MAMVLSQRSGKGRVKKVVNQVPETALLAGGWRPHMIGKKLRFRAYWTVPSGHTNDKNEPVGGFLVQLMAIVAGRRISPGM